MSKKRVETTPIYYEYRTTYIHSRGESTEQLSEKDTMAH